MSKWLISQYYSEVEKIIQYGGSRKETSIRTAFQNLLNEYCKARDFLLIPELDYPTKSGKVVYPDGTIKDALRLAWGYWESKDQEDNLDKEIEKKFIIRKIPKNLNLFDYERSEILQGYILASNDKELRIRKMDDYYYLTYKQGKGNIRDEWEIKLTKKEGAQVFNKIITDKYIKKIRYYIPYKNKTIELDIIPNIPFNLAEIEFDSVEEMNNFKFPGWFGEETDIKNKDIFNQLKS